MCIGHVDLEGLFSWCPPLLVAFTLFWTPSPQSSLNPDGSYFMEAYELRGFLYLFPAATRGSLSDDGGERHWSMSIAECH